MPLASLPQRAQRLLQERQRARLLARVGDELLDQRSLHRHPAPARRLLDGQAQGIAGQWRDREHVVLDQRPQRAVHEIAVEVGAQREHAGAALVPGERLEQLAEALLLALRPGPVGGRELEQLLQRVHDHEHARVRRPVREQGVDGRARIRQRRIVVHVDVHVDAQRLDELRARPVEQAHLANRPRVRQVRQQPGADQRRLARPRGAHGHGARVIAHVRHEPLDLPVTTEEELPALERHHAGVGTLELLGQRRRGGVQPLPQRSQSLLGLRLDALAARLRVVATVDRLQRLERQRDLAVLADARDRRPCRGPSCAGARTARSRPAPTHPPPTPCSAPPARIGSGPRRPRWPFRSRRPDVCPASDAHPRRGLARARGSPAPTPRRPWRTRCIAGDSCALPGKLTACVPARTSSRARSCLALIPP